LHNLKYNLKEIVLEKEAIKLLDLKRASPESWIYTSAAILFMCLLAYYSLYLNSWKNTEGIIASSIFTVISSAYLIYYGIYFIKKYLRVQHKHKAD